MAIEAALVTLLKTFGAVTAIVGSGDAACIRPYKLWQKDNLKTSDAIVIEVNSEEPQNSLDFRGGLIVADVSVKSVSEQLDGARVLAGACRDNGTSSETTHSTGLEAWPPDENTNNVIAGVQIDGISSGTRQVSFVYYSDESDEGYYIVDSHYTVIYQETV